MKKVLIVLLLLLIVPINIEAASVSSTQTFGDVLDDLEKLKKEYAEFEEQKKLTKEEYNKTSDEIIESDKKIKELVTKINSTIKKIEDLGIEIENKKEETNNLLVFFQVSNGEKTYLEYIFKATSFTDLIHRVSVVEQLSRYNNELIDTMNKMIKESEELKKQLQEDKETEEKERATLERKLSLLGKEISKIEGFEIDKDQEIEVLEARIASYRYNGCNDRDDLLIRCLGIPYNTGFIRPFEEGYVTSRYGIRKSPITGELEGHSGIDLTTPNGKKYEGEPLYAVADGYVAAKFQVSRGGKIVILQHNIRGQEYSSIYMHLLKYGDIKVGDIVYTNEVVGYMGGWTTASFNGGYDYATTGAHLHLTIAKGYLKSLANYRAYIVDPEDFIYFPYYFEGRTW